MNNRISDYIPNPTFEVVAAPGAQEEFFKVGNPEGKSRREILGKGIRALPGFKDPGPRLKLMDELGLDRALMWPRWPACSRSASGTIRRPPCRRPRPEPMDA